MSNIETAVYLVSNLFRIYVLYRFTKRFFSETKINKNIILSAFGLYFVINSLMCIFIPGIEVNILSNIIPYFALTFFYNTKTAVRSLVTL
jgi:hypothetical protein